MYYTLLINRWFSQWQRNGVTFFWKFDIALWILVITYVYSRWCLATWRFCLSTWWLCTCGLWVKMIKGIVDLLIERCLLCYQHISWAVGGVCCCGHPSSYWKYTEAAGIWCGNKLRPEMYWSFHKLIISSVLWWYGLILLYRNVHAYSLSDRSYSCRCSFCLVGMDTFQRLFGIIYVGRC